MKNLVIKVWKGDSKCLKVFLYPPLYILSLIYRIGITVRNWCYLKGILKTVETGIFVISVGNITLGGTGKTTVVERLATLLKEKGLNPGIITRGYKRKRKGTFYVDIAKDRPHEVGDEAYMLKANTNVPVLVSDKKYRAVWLGIKDFKIDVAIMDDGFQTRNIKKDMEIVIINSDMFARNIHLFPLGPYREPISSLKRADIILIKKDGQVDNVEPFTYGIPNYYFYYRPLYVYNLKNNMIGHYNLLKGKRVLAFSGLGDNDSFFNMLERLGYNLIDRVSFSDHHEYTLKDIKRLSKNKFAECLVTTAKDAVKIAHLQVPDNLFYLAVNLVIEKEDKLMENILSRINEFKRYTAYSN